MKPVINLDELDIISHEHGPFKSSYGVIGERIGAQQLGYNLTIVPPGKKVCPFHNHRVAEEMFFILEGTGTLRFGDKAYPLRAHDVVSAPAGGPEVAHQIVNTGTKDLKYLALSTRPNADICQYPDSGKVSVAVGKEGKRDLRLLFKEDSHVDYFLGEDK